MLIISLQKYIVRNRVIIENDKLVLMLFHVNTILLNYLKVYMAHLVLITQCIIKCVFMSSVFSVSICQLIWTFSFLALNAPWLHGGMVFLLFFFFELEQKVFRKYLMEHYEFAYWIEA